MHQYIKFKNNYIKLKYDNCIKLKYGGYVPDEEIPDEDEINFIESVMENVEEEATEKVEDIIDEDKKYIGDSNITTDEINTVVQIGKISGKVCHYADFSDDDFINTTSQTNMSKILMINNINTFDTFTDKYGFLKKKNLFIDWQKVANDYRGIYITSAVNERTNEAVFLNKVVPSFMIDDFGYIDDVILFLKEEEIKYEKNITYPFKGYVMDYYAVDENLFVTINDK